MEVELRLFRTALVSGSGPPRPTAAVLAEFEGQTRPCKISDMSRRTWRASQQQSRDVELGAPGSETSMVRHFCPSAGRTANVFDPNLIVLPPHEDSGCSESSNNVIWWLVARHTNMIMNALCLAKADSQLGWHLEVAWLQVNMLCPRCAGSISLSKKTTLCWDS